MVDCWVGVMMEDRDERVSAWLGEGSDRSVTLHQVAKSLRRKRKRVNFK